MTTLKSSSSSGIAKSVVNKADTMALASSSRSLPYIAAHFWRAVPNCLDGDYIAGPPACALSKRLLSRFWA